MKPNVKYIKKVSGISLRKPYKFLDDERLLGKKKCSYLGISYYIRIRQNRYSADKDLSISFELAKTTKIYKYLSTLHREHLRGTGTCDYSNNQIKEYVHAVDRAAKRFIERIPTVIDNYLSKDKVALKDLEKRVNYFDNEFKKQYHQLIFVSSLSTTE